MIVNKTEVRDEIELLKSHALESVRAGRWNDAIELFCRALDLNPHDDEAFVFRGWCYSYAGRLDAAIQSCRLDRMLLPGQFRPRIPAVLKGLEWVRNHIVPTGGIQVHTLNPDGYPEVTGYFVPTLLQLGEHAIARSFIEWLMKIQRADGSFPSPDGKPYIFDAGQVLRGYLAEYEHELNDSLVRAIRLTARYMLSNLIPNGGFKRQYHGGDPEIVESILLYALEPLRRAGSILGEESIVAAAEDGFSFYIAQDYALNCKTLTHYLGYEIEAAIDWGRRDLTKPLLEKLEASVTSDGFVPAKAGAGWTCCPGSAQLALCYYKIGRPELGDRILSWLETNQRESGGWPGSLGPGAAYVRDAEPSWAVKYYLDAHRHRVTAFMARNADNISPLVVREQDGRWDAILEMVEEGDRIVEVGCGRGRWLRLIKEIAPELSVTGIDPTPELLADLPQDIEALRGSFEELPCDSNTFDFVFTVDAIAHSTNLKGALDELIRIAKPGGRLLIIDKDLSHWGRLVCPPWEKWVDSAVVVEHLRVHCEGVQVRAVPYASRPADGLMLVWQGRKATDQQYSIRKSVVAQRQPRPLGCLIEPTGESFVLPSLSQIPEAYELQLYGSEGGEDPRMMIRFAGQEIIVLLRRNEHFGCSLRLNRGALSADHGRPELMIVDVNKPVLAVIPLLGEQRSGIATYEALLSLPVAKALLEKNLVLEASRLLRAIVALHQEHGEAHYLLGYSLTLLRDHADEAEKGFARALELGFDEFWIFYNRGCLYANIGRHEAAVADLEEADGLNPGHLETAQLLCAEALLVAKGHLQGNNVQEAARLLRTIVRLQPRHSEAHYLLGYALTLVNDATDESEKELTTALELGFDEFWVRFHRGCLYSKIDRHEAAVADLERARVLDPSHLGAAELLSAESLLVVKAALAMSNRDHP